MATANRKIMVMGAVALGAALLVPSLGLAFTNEAVSLPVSVEARGSLGSFTPASIDPKLAKALNLSTLKSSQKFRFTPANSQKDGKREMTIAVRVRSDKAQAVNIRNSIDNQSGKGMEKLAITPTAYSLGTAKGFRKFAIQTAASKSRTALDKPAYGSLDQALPDLAKIGKSRKKLAEKSRFDTRIALDEENTPGIVDRNQPITDNGGYAVDVSGRYKLSRNLDVRAGVRIESQRDRLESLTNDQTDNQAVYVGTQFRF